MAATKREAIEGNKEVDGLDVARKQELHDLVNKRYPNGLQTVASTITKIIEHKRATKETQSYKCIDNKPLSGYISTKDIVEL